MRAASLLAVLMLATASASFAQSSSRYATPQQQSSADELLKKLGAPPVARGDERYQTPGGAASSTPDMFKDVPNAGIGKGAAPARRGATSSLPTALSTTNGLRATTPAGAGLGSPPARLSPSPAGAATRSSPSTASESAAEAFQSLPPARTTQSTPLPKTAATPSPPPVATSAAPPTFRTQPLLNSRTTGGISGAAGRTPNPPQLQSRVAPQRNEAPATAMGQRERQTKNILEKMLDPHPRSRLAGRPVSLSSAVASAGSREQQAALVDAYWALTSTVADYYLGLAEQDELGRWKRKLPTFSAISDEQAKLDTRVDTSLLAAQAAQMRLARLMGSPGGSPLPSDVPFTGPYRTRIDTVFAGGAPREAQLLDRLLPFRLAELQDAAGAVARSQRWVERVEADSRNADGAGVMRALELLALTRRAFVQLARDYNLQINRYTQLVAPERVDTPRLVAMLIRTQPTAASGGSFVAGAGSERSLTTPRR